MSKTIFTMAVAVAAYYTVGRIMGRRQHSCSYIQVG